MLDLDPAMLDLDPDKLFLDPDKLLADFKFKRSDRDFPPARCAKYEVELARLEDNLFALDTLSISEFACGTGSPAAIWLSIFAALCVIA
jgi:hypothetical protein